MCQTQDGKFTTNKIGRSGLLPEEIQCKKNVTRKYHVDDSKEIRYNMIIGRDVLTALVLDFKFSKHVIIGGDGPYEGFLAYMVEVND